MYDVGSTCRINYMYTEETLKEDLVWDYVKDDVESFDLSREDAQFRNKQRRKIEGSAG